VAIKPRAIAAFEFESFAFNVALFGIGTDGGIWHKGLESQFIPSNANWVSIGGPFDSAPTTSAQPALEFFPRTTQVFGLSTADQMFTRLVGWGQWPPKWDDWKPLGGIFNGPAVTLKLGGSQDQESVAIVGLFPDNQPHLKLQTLGAWLPSEADWLPLGGQLIYEPALALLDRQVFIVFGVGTNREMFQLTVDATQWPPTLSGWQGVGGCFASPPAVATWRPGRIDVFGLGMGMDMLHRPWENGDWLHDWESIGGEFDSAPAVVSWDSNRLDIFGLGTDHKMYHRAWNGNEWIPDGFWEPLGQPDTGPFTSAPTVLSNIANTLQIFALGADFGLYRKSWDGDRWLPSPANWEPLGGTFLVPRSTSLPNRLDFHRDIIFSGDTPVGGWLTVTLFSDGSSRFSGHLHASGFPSYACSFGAALIDGMGRAYTFEGTGHVWGSDLPGSADFDWNVATPPNESLRDNWGDVFVCGGSKFDGECIVQAFPPGGLLHMAPVVLQGLAPGANLTVIPLVGSGL
jgi:hypothetical protein